MPGLKFLFAKYASILPTATMDSVCDLVATGCLYVTVPLMFYLEKEKKRQEINTLRHFTSIVDKSSKTILIGDEYETKRLEKRIRDLMMVDDDVEIYRTTEINQTSDDFINADDKNIHAMYCLSQVPVGTQLSMPADTSPLLDKIINKSLIVLEKGINTKEKFENYLQANDSTKNFFTNSTVLRVPDIKLSVEIPIVLMLPTLSLRFIMSSKHILKVERVCEIWKSHSKKPK